MDLDNRYGTLEIQKELLVLLKEFDSFCQRTGIKYSLSSGSLLGAVRHKGFIPWDDDLDCIMDRDNYNSFSSLICNHPVLYLEKETPSCLWTERVRFRETSYQGNYTPSLDIFILDNHPDNKLFASIKLLTIKMLQGMIKYELSLEKGNFFMKACSLVTFLLGLPFSHAKKYKWYCKVAQWGNRHNSHYLSIYHDQWKALRFMYPREIMNKTIRIPFEDTTINALKEYDKYLSIIYGQDYMKPPVMAERVPIHI